MILTRSNAKKNKLHPELESLYRCICKAIPFDFITDSRPEYRMRLHVVRFQIEEGVYENIITNLPEKEFSWEQIRHIYHLRWDEIENKIKIIISDRLQDYFGEAWLVKGVPKNIYTKAKKIADDRTYDLLSNNEDVDDVEIWDFVPLADFQPIILNGKNWSAFFEDILIRPEETKIAGGKEAKTQWILRLSAIKNKLVKESYRNSEAIFRTAFSMSIAM